MDQRLHPGLREPRREPVALIGLDDIQMPRRISPVGDVGQGQPGVGQRFLVERRNRRAPRVPLVELGELDAEQRRLHRVKPRIDALLLVHIAHRRSVITKPPNPRRDLRIAGRYSSGITQRAQILARVKAPACDAPTATTDPLAPVPRAMRLRRIVDQQQPVVRGNGCHRIKIGRLAIQMRRQDRLGARGDRGLDPRRVEIVRRRIGLDRHRRRAGHANRQLCRDIAVARNDHFIARANVRRLQREVERVEPVSDPDAMRCAAIGRPSGLERFDFRPANIPARSDHPIDRSIDVGA